MATKEQLRALRKKYGLGEFRKTKNYKKRRSYSRSMVFKKKKRSGKKSGSRMGIWGTILGVGAYVLYEAIVRPMLPLGNISNTVLSFGEILLGLWIGKKGGILGNLGKAMVTLNAYVLVKTFIPVAVGGKPAFSYTY